MKEVTNQLPLFKLTGSEHMAPQKLNTGSVGLFPAEADITMADVFVHSTH